MEPEVFIVLSILVFCCMAAFIAYLFGRVIVALQMRSAEVEAKRIENKRARNHASLVAPDARGALPVSLDLINSGASVEQLLALLTQVVEANKIHPMPPQHLTFAPHTSADRSLDITSANGMATATGGGGYNVLDSLEDGRFSHILPRKIEIEVDHGNDE